MRDDEILTTMHSHEGIKSAIWNCLNRYDTENATFLAERLCAQVQSNSGEAQYLLATCYYRSGKQVQACDILRKTSDSADSKLLLAKCYMDLKKIKQAENALLDGNVWHFKPVFDQLEEIEKTFGDSACFALQLLGKIYQETQRMDQAKHAYSYCLRLNPFLFVAYQSLCDLGEKPDPNEYFQLRPSHKVSALTGNAANNNFELNLGKETTPASFIFPQKLTFGSESSIESNSKLSNLSIITRSRLARLTRGQDLLSQGQNTFGRPDSSPDSIASQNSTPDESPVITPTMFGGSNIGHLPAAPSKKLKNRRDHDSPLQQSKPFVINQANNSTTSSLGTSALNLTPSPGPSTTSSQQRVRRSTRLYTNSNGSVKENEKSLTSSKKAAAPKSPRSGRKSSSTKTQSAKTTEMNEKNLIESSCYPSAAQEPNLLHSHSIKEFLSILRQIGQAYQYLAHYDCRKSIEILDQLPDKHYKTGWVLCAKGKAYYELSDYKTAVKIYEECRELEPSRLQGMEVLSTAYWYLENEVALSALCHEMQEINRNSVETCLALGNCFSQQREHDTAIKFFKRAVQLNDKCAYAFTLLGHEHVQTEELEWGLTCFRTAIRLDLRHYNAWLGLGSIYYKQERYHLADLHFKKAYAINPHSSVVMNFVAVSLQALKKSDEAMKILNKAIRANPENPICKFNRAKILFANEKYEEALKELEELKELVPKEAQVYFLTGKVHAKLGNTHLELMHFSWMMDLDPKGANSQIKEALDPALNRTVASVASQSSGLLDANDAAMATDPPPNDSLQEAAGIGNVMNMDDMHESSDESL
ncbi:Hypothetical predicted protein [Cloeon dipterum]|uniref:Cell division cycle protein 27 homolog n=1 Tax=Cloeon dipterum TaxID=197152 RepID=A0A8S1CLZ8_9INSE|nr:Hypothetical predicted protein [Cloeon dipterum]